jgi:hypothetical protein
MTERKTYAEIKAGKAAKRAAKGKPPVKTFREIGEENLERKETKRERKAAKKAASS